MRAKFPEIHERLHQVMRSPIEQRASSCATASAQQRCLRGRRFACLYPRLLLCYLAQTVESSASTSARV